VDKELREKTEKALSDFVIRIAGKENATPEELEALSRVAGILIPR